jgi:hypothetical protein
MKKQLHKTKLSTVLFSIFCSLFSIFSQAQDYQYEWAKSGGGGLSGSDSVFNEQQDETIRDVVIDADNNSYFLADLQGGTVSFQGIPLTHYGSKDILIIALDCEGNFRWSHTIGGGNSSDNAYKLGLDSTNGLYVGVNVNNTATYNGFNHPPVHFSQDDVMPLVPVNSNNGNPHEAFKRGFLLKFDKDTGDYLWRKALQGDVTAVLSSMIVGRIFIDSNDVIHQIVALQEGTHLDGLAIVGEGELKYFLVKYDTDGDILGIPQELPMSGGYNPRDNIFLYDEQLNRYYIAGSLHVSLTYQGNVLHHASNGRFYILAFDGATFDELWRKEINKEGSGSYNEKLTQVVIDENSNIYLAGKIRINGSTLEYFGDYLLPQNIGSYTQGHLPFVMKLNSAGEVQWIRTPDGYTNNTAFTGLFENKGLTLNGNEIATLPNGSAHIWGDYSYTRPDSHHTDPVILRLDKDTGEVIGLHDIKGNSGTYDEFRVITTDNDGNYIAGGHFSGYQGLFTDSPNGVGPLSAMGKTDFFMAKLSAYACGSGGNPCLGVEIDAPTGNSTQEVQIGMTLADLEVDGENLQWYADAELTEPLAENHVVENNTTYYVTQTLGGCTSEALAITVSTLGVADFQKMKIKLYPNPTNGLLYIETSQELQSYEVYNLIGQKLLSNSFTGSIDMKDLSKGTYIIRLTTQEGTVITEKVIKE